MYNPNAPRCLREARELTRDYASLRSFAARPDSRPVAVAKHGAMSGAICDLHGNREVQLSLDAGSIPAASTNYDPARRNCIPTESVSRYSVRGARSLTSSRRAVSPRESDVVWRGQRFAQLPRLVPYLA